MDVGYEYHLIHSPLILPEQPFDYYLASHVDLSMGERMKDKLLVKSSGPGPSLW